MNSLIQKMTDSSISGPSSNELTQRWNKTLTSGGKLITPELKEVAKEKEYKRKLAEVQERQKNRQKRAREVMQEIAVNRMFDKMDLNKSKEVDDLTPALGLLSTRPVVAPMEIDVQGRTKSHRIQRGSGKQSSKTRKCIKSKRSGLFGFL